MSDPRVCVYGCLMSYFSFTPLISLGSAEIACLWAMRSNSAAPEEPCVSPTGWDKAEQGAASGRGWCRCTAQWCLGPQLHWERTRTQGRRVQNLDVHQALHMLKCCLVSGRTQTCLSLCWELAVHSGFGSHHCFTRTLTGTPYLTPRCSAVSTKGP